MKGMHVSAFRCVGGVVWMTILFSAIGAVALGADVEKLDASRSRSSAIERVPLFAAIQKGDVTVSVVPHREERVTLQIANRTDRPIAIEVPPAIAAVPVLAQFADPFGGQNNLGQNRNAPQALGFPGPNNAQVNGGNNNAGFPFPNPGIFNVPAGKVIKVKLPATCLEFGKPTPNSRHPYEIQPLETVSEHSEVAAILAMVGRKEVTRRIGQLAIWHIANGTSWRELASLRTDRIDGLVTPVYSADEIQKARALVAQVQEALDAKGESSTRLRATASR